MSYETQWTRERFEQLFEEALGGSESSRDKKRIRLLRVATELFTKHGYRKTSVDEIAQRAGVAKGTVYTIFESKTALLVEAIAVEKQVMIKVLEPLLSGEIPERERLRFYLHVVLTAVRQLPLSARLMTGDNELMLVLHEMDPAFLQANRARGASMVAELIELAAPGVFDEAERHSRAEVVQSLGFFGGMLLDPTVRGSISFEEHTRILADSIAYGLVRPPDDRGRG